MPMTQYGCIIETIYSLMDFMRNNKFHASG